MDTEPGAMECSEWGGLFLRLVWSVFSQQIYTMQKQDSSLISKSKWGSTLYTESAELNLF